MDKIYYLIISFKIKSDIPNSQATGKLRSRFCNIACDMCKQLTNRLDTKLLETRVSTVCKFNLKDKLGVPLPTAAPKSPNDNLRKTQTEWLGNKSYIIRLHDNHHARIYMRLQLLINSHQRPIFITRLLIFLLSNINLLNQPDQLLYIVIHFPAQTISTKTPI